MELKQTETFETHLQLVRQKPPGKLRASDIRRLLRAAGQRPTESNIAVVSELLVGSTANSPTVFEILAEQEISARPDPWLALLRPILWRAVTGWLTQPPPANEDLANVRAWLQAQFPAETESTTIPPDRIRAVLLWLGSRFRNPEFFLQCLLEVGGLSVSKTKRKKSQPRKREAQTGYIMTRLAKRVITAGRGQQPKLGKLAEIAQIAAITLEHVGEKSVAADMALRKQAELEGALAEQLHVRGEHEEKIQELVSEKEGLEQRSREQAGEMERLGTAHQQAIDHADAQVAEGKKAMLTDLRTKLEPKLKDAKLYLDRPTPVAAQALRLIAEMEEILKTRDAR
jgi:hypothetical protein